MEPWVIVTESVCAYSTNTCYLFVGERYFKLLYNKTGTCSTEEKIHVSSVDDTCWYTGAY